jgi:hypothetical protein
VCHTTSTGASIKTSRPITRSAMVSDPSPSPTVRLQPTVARQEETCN